MAIVPPESTPPSAPSKGSPEESSKEEDGLRLRLGRPLGDGVVLSGVVQVVDWHVQVQVKVILVRIIIGSSRGRHGQNHEQKKLKVTRHHTLSKCINHAKFSFSVLWENLPPS